MRRTMLTPPSLKLSRVTANPIIYPYSEARMKAAPKDALLSCKGWSVAVISFQVVKIKSLDSASGTGRYSARI